MVNVTQESLSARIAELESGPRSLKEDFALQAYRMLLPFVTLDPNEFIEVSSPVFHEALNAVKTTCTHPNMDDIAFEVDGFPMAYIIGKRSRDDVEKFRIRRKYILVVSHG